MRHYSDTQAAWPTTQPALDSETRSLLRLFLAPILETANNWNDISSGLAAKGYRLGFRDGHMVILTTAGQVVCTGSGLGVPLAQISQRIGRPCIKADRGGHSGSLA
ncbi:hypothetical protein [Tropicibacter naphthalenivorans]|uniref:Uncharacterized protein n=1 Tax=Tropicibacter naphthalenivorans TaxID=441103 RepID=A0A0P1FZW6_9RHOB|nr:hypothetical protein [Tropicibacter naphthalenivorans]CUH74759.1 hypothetical protein TRN7648_00070 [Tropicibacter naphthalenivorans]SMC49281.1 hypothetical protein SAMN04488093_101810 [Tropicibacter naphthalenivorans]